ncbi:MAG: RsmD family RNA methyltransferase [Planctomycetes bacterium]|nr:RsmD family RNA methyltransferase [Planctomycetota bacterium]
MRIIAGTFRGRRLDAPEGLTTRPMTDRVRENLFNLLGLGACEGSVVLDLFCGSGALALEALSRGARAATLVDADGGALATARENVERLGVAGQVRLERRDALQPGPWIVPDEGGPYTLLFVDPPYKMTADPDGRRRLAEMTRRLVDLGCVAPGTVAMLRAERGVDVGPPWDGFELDDTRTYGTTTLYFMSRKSATEP